MIVGFFPATTMPDADWWQALWPDPAKVLVEMGVQPGMLVVDLCCGDGLFTAPLARTADRVYAIDIDPTMLDGTLRGHATDLRALLRAALGIANAVRCADRGDAGGYRLDVDSCGISGTPARNQRSPGKMKGRR